MIWFSNPNFAIPPNSITSATFIIMEYPWRLRPPTANFCPVCSNSHFPFCPPPPPQYFRPPPPPPDQFFHARQPPPPPPPPPQPSYDPFVDHQGCPTVNPYPPPPPPAQVPAPPPPWCGNPNFSSNYYGTIPYPDYDQSAQVGAKRMRFDNANESYAGAFSDDQRRLKLIRDHGAVGHGYDKSYNGGYNKHLNQSFEAGNLGDQKGNPQIKPEYSEHQFAYHQPENKADAEFARANYNQSDGKMVQNHIYGNNAHGSDGFHNYNQPGGNPGSLQYDNSPNQEQIRPFPVGGRDNQFFQSHQHHLEPTPAHYSMPNHTGFKVQPPLPPNPPLPMPVEPPRLRFPEPAMASGPGSLFPIAVDAAPSFQPTSTFVSEGITSVSSHYSSHATPNSSGYYSEENQAMKIASSKTYSEHEVFPPKHIPLDKPKLIDASHILKHPHRANRPDHIVIILRGLPGSGKSYLAKILRDLEVEHGCIAPRIHSMDEYFMTEVEKVEESEGSKSSGSGRGKKPTIKKVMEYCYEPEMEEAYRSSMLKAFKKTLDEGNFPFVIVDDRNLRVADFAQFWATAKRSGYEVYLLEATYKDPAGCAARNVHGFSQNDIQDMANQWEEAPSLYMKLDIKSLLHGDDLEENGIQEVDMDTDDGNFADPSVSEDVNDKKDVRQEGDSARAERLKDGNGVETHPVEEVKELGKSKWSNYLDEDDAHKSEATTENSIALSNLMRAYSKKGKSVRWADKVGSSIGFSIGSGKSGIVSLIIGPGCGYNSKTNPPPEDEKLGKRTGEPRKRTIFQEQLRAEGEAFKAVFDKRRHKIGGLDADDE